MTGGDALAASFHCEGVRVIFGLPGVQLYHAMDGLHRQPEIRFITTRHEQAAGYMADGYARASGRIGTALVVPGPGLQNASATIGTAYAASSPVLVVSGQVPRDLIGVDRGVLHEVNDQLDIIRPVTKWATRVLEATEIPAAVHEAFYKRKTGDPGQWRSRYRRRPFRTRYGINEVVVVFNDNAFGKVLRDQRNTFDGRTIGSELHNPDFVKLAEAYGARGVRVEDPEARESSLCEALAIESPTLIEVPVGPMPYPY